MAVTISNATITAETITPSDGSVNNNKVAENAELARRKLELNTFQVYDIPLTALRKWDDFAVLLPATAATDDMGIFTGTLGTRFPTVRTSDADNTTVTQKYGFLFYLPPEYDNAGTVQVRLSGGMVTTISDNTATYDVAVYKHDGKGLAATDLSTTTGPTSINALVSAGATTTDFTITATGFQSGDQLIGVVTVDINDIAVGGGVVIGEIVKTQMLLNIRG